jgi:hypothetical protein
MSAQQTLGFIDVLSSFLVLGIGHCLNCETIVTWKTFDLFVFLLRMCWRVVGIREIY